MKMTVTSDDFDQAFRNMGRENQYSYEGRLALYDYLLEFEDDTDTEMELDVIAICCDFTEYDNLKEFQKEYGEDYPDIDSIGDSTTVIPVGTEGFLIQNF